MTGPANAHTVCKFVKSDYVISIISPAIIIGYDGRTNTCLLQTKIVL